MKVDLFGSTHSIIGDSDSNLILKTKGKIKLQIGNKFIDLLKDGKLNVSKKASLIDVDTKLDLINPDTESNHSIEAVLIRLNETLKNIQELINSIKTK